MSCEKKEKRNKKSRMKNKTLTLTFEREIIFEIRITMKFILRYLAKSEKSDRA